MKKNLLLNPQQMAQVMGDPKTQALLNQTVAFFEHKGNYSMRIDSKARRLPSDWYQFIKESGLFATMLTPAGYGDDPDARWDHYRISATSELLGFYGLYQYNYQVSVLGVGPIWMSDNEVQKRELAQLLKEGHVFAFGMSERNHGADLYSNEANIKRVGEGRYVANGEKYYIGNSSRAPKISCLGRDADTGEFAFWVVDCRDRHCKYCGDIDVVGMFTGQLGTFDMIEYPIAEKDILARGDKAFALGLSTINIGKTQTSIKVVGMTTHALYECINHSHNRYLYGKRVTDMPHIRRSLLEVWSRIVMTRMYAYRAVDYFRQANKETDRRYLLFNPLQKGYATTESERAVIMIHNIMAAKAYETDTYAETAVRQTGNSMRLEGTAHVNMSQVVKFIPNYFHSHVDYPLVPDGKMVKDDTANCLDQGFGRVREIKFADYRRSFAGCELPNVMIFLEQAADFGRFSDETPMTKAQSANPDFMLNVGNIFGAIVYGQLVYEKCRIEGVEDLVIDQLFSYLVKDINGYVTRAVSEYAGYFEPGQQENLQRISRLPRNDFDREEQILKDYVFALDGAYKSSYGVVINGEKK